MNSNPQKTIEVHFKGEKLEKIDKETYNALKDLGLLWEFYPDAPTNWPDL